ncbi:MAG: TrkH family potassium uptake protein [Succinivibrionaceae bacterium]|nr:TrkH family potassium uptake protein [Ruminobacter sp.]MDY5778422.1 TrkH family potassium uptake protein [Succinivibrionaceae bacterium]MEE1339558.1 TrkH family potassium uptake protein [Succinivibrionaceae bacterium]
MIINIRILASLLGNVLLFLMIAMAIPLLYSFVTVSKGSAEFLASTIIVGTFGLILKQYGKTKNLHMGIKDMFLFTSLVWIFILIFSAIPFVLVLKLSVINALYEAASAITTTGSTIIKDIDGLPRSVLLWRSILQYIGGIGFIAVGIAILPNLNVGGMKLFQTENSQQSSENVTPKSKTLAKGILLTYVIVTFLAFISYYLLGMSSFDAVNHALTSVATGGMSTHAASMEYFSPSIHWAVSFFMFIGSLPFMLLAYILRGDIKSLFKDAQVRGFVLLVIALATIMTISLIVTNQMRFSDAIRLSVFNVINILSSSGYTLGDISNFNNLITIIFFFILPLGACSGSTSGGLKLFRLQIALTLFKRQMHQLMHPSAIFPQRYNNHNVNDNIIRSIISFFFAYLVLAFISTLILAGSGIDILDSFTLTLTCLSNIGPALGPNFGSYGDFTVLNSFQEIVLITDMMFGRLEVLTMLICFMPSFWKI